MSTKYKILFSVDVQHEYYAGLKCTDFDMEPSPETALLLKRHQLLYKVTGNKLVVLTKVDKVDKPFAPLAVTEKLVFYQRLNNPLFIEVSNIDRASFATKRFYYSNINQNEQEDIFYLTSPVKNYANADAYDTGGFSKNASDTVFEALQPKLAGDSHNTTNAAYWVSKGKFQYANANDLINLVPLVAKYPVASAKDFHVRIYTLDAVNNTYTQLAKSYTVKLDEAVKQLEVDLRGLVPGKYKVEINGTPFTVYADDNCVGGSCFAVVEILNHLPNGNDFALLDAAGKVKDTKVGDKSVWLNFVIRYANRRAFWKYITKAAKPPGSPIISNIKTAGVPDPAPVVFDAFSTDPIGAPARKDYFVSKAQLALTEATDQNNFEITFTDLTYVPVMAPKPNLTLSGIITKPPAENHFYCNIFLNY